jgi:hypothetical protein
MPHRHEDKSTGVGADLFVRKVRPGASVGVGYVIDVYENGIKIDTITRRNKKEVKDVIDEYKSKYNTSRSFLNEQQVHVTYKTKEERGEIAMQDNIEKTLYKQADTIKTMLQKLLDPNIPIKIRTAESDVMSGNIDFLPETKLPENSNGFDNPSEQEISKQIVTKLIEYFQEVSPDGGGGASGLNAAPVDNPVLPKQAPEPNVPVGLPHEASVKVATEDNDGSGWPEVDELYNAVKKWMTAVKKKLHEFEKANQTTINTKSIADYVGSVVHSGDPEKIKSETGIDVSPETAVKIKEITLMDVGNAPKGTPGAQQDLTTGTLDDKVAATFDVLNKIKNQIRQQPDMPDNLKVENAVEEVPGGKKVLKNNPSELEDDDTYTGTIMQNYADDTYDDHGDTKRSPDRGNRFDSFASNFWNYAKNAKKVETLENIFIKWANKVDLPLNDLRIVWGKVQNDVNILFSRSKEALVHPPSLSIFDLFKNEVFEFVRVGKYTDGVIQSFIGLYENYLTSVGDAVAQRKMGEAHTTSADEIRMENIKSMIRQYTPTLIEEYPSVIASIFNKDFARSIGTAAANVKKYEALRSQIQQLNPAELIENWMQKQSVMSNTEVDIDEGNTEPIE